MRRLIILHVEDQREDALQVAQACETAQVPADFHGVPGGAEAVSYLKGEADFTDRGRHPFPDVIVLDLKPPGMSGLEFLGWLRRESEFQSLPVLVYTSARDQCARAMTAGATGFFAKPDRVREDEGTLTRKE